MGYQQKIVIVIALDNVIVIMLLLLENQEGGNDSVFSLHVTMSFIPIFQYYTSGAIWSFTTTVFLLLFFTIFHL